MYLKCTKYFPACFWPMMVKLGRSLEIGEDIKIQRGTIKQIQKLKFKSQNYKLKFKSKM